MTDLERAVAKAYAGALGVKFGAMDVAEQENNIRAAKAALAVVREALREPTGAMIHDEAAVATEVTMLNRKAIWRAMFDKSAIGPLGERQKGDTLDPSGKVRKCEIKWCTSGEPWAIRVNENIHDGSWNVGICRTCADKLGLKDGSDLPDDPDVVQRTLLGEDDA